MLPLCKFYRYLIYRLYNFSGDTPMVNVIITLTLIHTIQLVTLLLIVNGFTSFTSIKVFLGECGKNPLFHIAFMVLHYFLFYDKKKWGAIRKEFKDESPRHKKIGLIVVLAYLLGTVFLFFILGLRYDMNRDYLKYLLMDK